MSKLRALVAEADAALDLYLAGRTGQQFHKTAFILADDLCELASKLFLITADPAWSDTGPNGGPPFKTFHAVTGEVLAARPDVAELIARVRSRRTRRNGFFHSAHLLDLTLHARDVVEALRDMLDYGATLFATWPNEVAATGNLETAEAILRLDCLAFSDPAIAPRIAAILGKQPRTGKQSARGCEVAHHPDDHHLRLAIRNGGKDLRDKLRLLLL